MHPQTTHKTRTRIDTGRWWRPSPIHLTLTESELTLHAPGPRPFTATVPLAECHASRYHHPTGELILEPAEALPIRNLRIPPQEALQILRFIQPSPTTEPVC
ncbi:MAG: hypothetical protein ACNA8L_04410 [Luteolibacter sp.]